VQGLDAVPASQRPPVNVVRVAFQLMVGIGTLLALLGVAYLVVRIRRKRLPESRWFYRAVVAAGPLALVALIAGWVTTEVGRQPWVVYRVDADRRRRHRRAGNPDRLRDARHHIPRGRLRSGVVLRRLARAPLEVAADAERG